MAEETKAQAPPALSLSPASEAPGKPVVISKPKFRTAFYMWKRERKQIWIRPGVHSRLKSHGAKGETFGDVLTKLMDFYDQYHTV